MMPVSLPKRLDNMNAGALIGSLIVIDEAHLLESGKSLGTTIEMLDRLKHGLCRFVIMTATMSDDGLRWLAKKLDAKILHISDDEIRTLPSQRNKVRIWEWLDQEMTWETVWKSHRKGRTIAIVNTVGRSQNLFEDLERAVNGTDTKVLLLHSRFFREDRERTEALLSEYFGPKAFRCDVILVSTQVVEAGIDISADHLHADPTCRPLGSVSGTSDWTRQRLQRIPPSSLSQRRDLGWHEGPTHQACGRG